MKQLLERQGTVSVAMQMTGLTQRVATVEG